jgi:hypothetical protein
MKQAQIQEGLVSYLDKHIELGSSLGDADDPGVLLIILKLVSPAALPRLNARALFNVLDVCNPGFNLLLIPQTEEREIFVHGLYIPPRPSHNRADPAQGFGWSESERGHRTAATRRQRRSRLLGRLRRVISLASGRRRPRPAPWKPRRRSGRAGGRKNSDESLGVRDRAWTRWRLSRRGRRRVRRCTLALAGRLLLRIRRGLLDRASGPDGGNLGGNLCRAPPWPAAEGEARPV